MSLETSTPKRNQEISPQGQLTTAVAYLGQFALSAPSSLELLTEAATLLSQILPAELVLIWEMEAGGKYLSLRALSGWRNGTAFPPQLPVENHTFEGCILNSQYPLVVDSFVSETRFQLPGSFLDHELMSGAGIRIGTLDNPSGVIEIFSQQPQSISQGDLLFLQSVTSVIALFMDSKRKQAQWSAKEQEYQKHLMQAQSVVPSAYVEWDRYEIKNRLVESRERERLQLAQELHDMPIQDLYGLMYQLDDLKEVIQDNDSLKTLHEIDRTLHRVVNNLRSLCGELRPPSLSPFGLEVAIRDHVTKLRSQSPDIHIHLELMRDQQVLSDSLRLCLFRIYQQAVNNILRHANATDIHIRFRWDEQVTLLEVEDNGSGFDVPKHWVDLVRQEHFGLVGLAERVESVRGNLEIISSIGHGTLVRVIVPRR